MAICNFEIEKKSKFREDCEYKTNEANGRVARIRMLIQREKRLLSKRRR